MNNSKNEPKKKSKRKLTKKKIILIIAIILIVAIIISLGSIRYLSTREIVRHRTALFCVVPIGRVGESPPKSGDEQKKGVRPR